MSLWPHFLAHRVDFRSRTVLGLIACTHFVDAACGVRRSVVSVCVCVFLCVCLLDNTVSPTQTDEPIEVTFRYHHHHHHRHF